MKKKIMSLLLAIIVLFSVSACSVSGKSNKKKSVESLMDTYVKGIEKIDINMIVSVFPDFMRSYMKEYINEDMIKEGFKNYGNVSKITYKITDKIKLEQTELDEFNKTIKKFYNASGEFKECYEIKGKFTFKGSKKTATEDFEEIWYCNYDNSWYLIGG